jgi:uncharacterized 2Fe-2S/4Fe-4S cluster protein (DUF4445 family)
MTVPGSTPTDALVVFTPSGRRGRFPLGTPVLDAARSLGVYIESVCGGRGICTRCQVVPCHGVFAKHGITSAADHLSPPTEAEARHVDKRTVATDRRLSCQTRIAGDVVIDVPADVAVNAQVVRKPADARPIVVNPAIRLIQLTLPPADLQLPLGALDRIIAQITADHGITAARADAHVLAGLTAALSTDDRTITVALHTDTAAPEITAVWPGSHDQCFGIACDIGSTTIACHLVDMVSGETVASAGMANPQVRFGEDLMSRVSYVMMNPDGLAVLTESVRAAINTLIEQVTATARITGRDVLDAVLVGNPVMHHIFLGLDPTPLGQAPFELTIAAAVAFPARDLGLVLHPGARIYVLPCIAGHVGADAAAVALAEAPDPSADTQTTLIVDIGTNAEILLSDGQRMCAASSPTGPAFEGAQISGGQRAAPGAVERVRIDPATLEPRVSVIGTDLWSDAPGFAEATRVTGVTGICGSGIIEAIGEMFLAGIITTEGAIDGRLAARSPRIVARGRTFAYRLWDGPIELLITQGDVRAIQLAKGALYAGIRLLMDHMGCDRVDRIKLAGAFGTHIDPLYAMIIGLIPDCSLANVTAVGNAAGTGARMALLNCDHRRAVEGLVRHIDKIETAMQPRFQALFVSAMAFPNAVDAFPELAKVAALPARLTPAATPRRRAVRAEL